MKKLKVTIQNSEEMITNEVEAVSKDSTLTYQEEDRKVTWDAEKNILRRENEEYEMTFFFEEGNIHTVYKEYEVEVDIPIKVTKNIQKEDSFEIEYEIENEKFTYRIEEIK